MTPMTVSGRTIASAGVYLPYRFDLPRLPNLDFFLNAGFCIGGVNLFCLLEPGGLLGAVSVVSDSSDIFSLGWNCEVVWFGN